MRDLSTLAALYAIGIVAVPWPICRSLPPVENSPFNPDEWEAIDPGGCAPPVLVRRLNPVENPLNEDTDRDGSADTLSGAGTIGRPAQGDGAAGKLHHPAVSQLSHGKSRYSA